MTTTTDSMLSCSVDGAVATLVINRPPANALTPDLLAELSRAFGHCAEDDAVKAVVLTGTGRFFIAGADIRLLASIASAQEGEAIAQQGQAVLHRIDTLEKPVIAAINGVCLGEVWNSPCVATFASRLKAAGWASRKSTWASCPVLGAPSGFQESSVNRRRWS